jgi:hypothetical protein
VDEYRVTRLQQGEHRSGIRLRAGVRLHVRELGAEQGLDPIDGELFDDVDVLAATVVPPTRVALGVLVGQDRALSLHDRDWREVLRCDHFQRLLLTAQLRRNRRVDLRVRLSQ